MNRLNKLAFAISIVFAIFALSMSAQADVVYRSQTRSVSASAWGGGGDSVVAPDYLEFNESATARNASGWSNYGNAWQHSTLSTTRIEAMGGGVAIGGNHETGADTRSFFEVTFTIETPTTYALSGYWEASSNAQSLADVRVEFEGPSGMIYSSRSIRDFGNDIYIFNDDYDVSGMLAPGTYRLTTYVQGHAAGSSDGLSGSYGLMLLIPKPVEGPCQGQWLANDPPSLLDGPVYSMVNWDPDGAGPQSAVLVAGGSFTAAGSTSLNSIATMNPATEQWSALGTGMNGAVRALAVLPSGELIAGGDFTMAGSESANHVAVWDGTEWRPVGAGVGDSVVALLPLPNGDIVAGHGATVSRWSGTVWTQVGEAFNGSVRALTLMQSGEIIAGGEFFFLINDEANIGVAKWTGTEWVPMGGGVPFVVFSMVTMPNGDVVAGDYDAHVSIWNGSNWAPLGNRNSGGAAFAMTVMPNGDLVVAGGFDNWGQCCPWKYPVTRWNGTTWTKLGSGMDNNVYALLPLPDGSFLAAGEFNSTDGYPTPYVARWINSEWTTMDQGAGMNAQVTALATLPNGDVVAGGNFTESNGVSTNHIAFWDGSDSVPLGSGVNESVSALAVLADGDVIAGGAFTAAGDVTANRIARWDGLSWSSLGSGMNGSVYSLIVMPNGDIVAGGAFTTAGGISANRIARWNGSEWSALGAGMQGWVYVLALMPNGDLVAGSSFSNSYTFARWNGTSWSQVAPSLSGYASDLIVTQNGDLIAGGSFYNVGGINNHTVVRWDGVAWTGLGTGFGDSNSISSVYSLAALPDGGLIAGGSFYSTGGVLTRNIARWDGSVWSDLGVGMNSSVHAVAILPGGDLVAGGRFTRAGGEKALRIARYVFESPAEITQQPSPTATCRDGSASFHVSVSDPALALRWQIEIAPQGSDIWMDLSDGQLPFDTGSGASVAGADSDTLIIGDADLAAALRYRAVITSECGGVTSEAALLTVCVGDYNCDGGIDGSDLESFFNDWESASLNADLNSDGGIDGQDIEVFFVHWENGC